MPWVNPYKNEDGAVQLRPSVAAFVDILGYRAYIERVFREGKGAEELARLRKALDEAYRFLKEESAEKAKMEDKILHFQVRSFTDHLVIGFPIPSHGDAYGALVMVIAYIEYFQMALSQQGYFVRGAISIGDLYVDEDIIFGPALLEAYRAEQELAVFPRVIFCPSAKEPFQLNPMLKGRKMPGVLIDSDGRVFIDYLAENVMIAYQECGPYMEALEEHRDSVITKLKEFSNNPYVRAKYEWAAAYHNAFCDRYPDEFGKEHKIPNDVLVSAPRDWILPTDKVPDTE